MHLLLAISFISLLFLLLSLYSQIIRTLCFALYANNNIQSKCKRSVFLLAFMCRLVCMNQHQTQTPISLTVVECICIYGIHNNVNVSVMWTACNYCAHFYIKSVMSNEKEIYRQAKQQKCVYLKSSDWYEILIRHSMGLDLYCCIIILYRCDEYWYRIDESFNQSKISISCEEFTRSNNINIHISSWKKTQMMIHIFLLNFIFFLSCFDKVFLLFASFF